MYLLKQTFMGSPGHSLKRKDNKRDKKNVQGKKKE